MRWRNPRDIDQGLVRARKHGAFSIGSMVTKCRTLLWRKVGPKLSAGRVQSVAVRLIVEREQERIAFRSATCWDLIGQFATQAKETSRRN